MLALISPAKKLSFEETAPFETHSQPAFLDDCAKLANEARSLTRADLSRLMKISDSLADLNYQRFQDFSTPFTLANAKQAALMFNGDTYVGLDAPSLSEADFAYAQDHLRILSGLYGLLRPLDLMQPYRLEMGTRFKNSRGNDLYAWWGDSLTRAINDITASHKDGTVINCASNEYFKAVKTKELKTRLITPVFKEIKAGQAKVVGFSAKRARGMMARFIIQNRIEAPESIKDFKEGGYQFRPDLSNDNDWVFTRDHDAA
ncbi:peroxide stress protein YaaA [Aestuariispira insulae]|uniref:UPF0246 protein DFP90_105199 n=1 Tax=Aestuariispira insulae TaxID=1461337 RepID=A0A3D9HJZ9_9PROT|nr:peroxide stress protein YaaA [Aestuariispira insulae]RED49827.1 hypothetical protein DFP90_105199 [Aestuariispira insulae]